MTSKLRRKVYVVDLSLLKKFVEWEEDFSRENKDMYDNHLDYSKACSKYILMRWNQHERFEREEEEMHRELGYKR